MRSSPHQRRGLGQRGDDPDAPPGADRVLSVQLRSNCGCNGLERKRLQDRDRNSEARNSEASSATPIATGTARKTTIVKVRATPSAKKANSAMRVVARANARPPTSQALHPRMTLVRRLREMTIMLDPCSESLQSYTAKLPPARALSNRYGQRLTKIRIGQHYARPPRHATSSRRAKRLQCLSAHFVHDAIPDAFLRVGLGSTPGATPGFYSGNARVRRRAHGAPRGGFMRSQQFRLLCCWPSTSARAQACERWARAPGPPDVATSAADQPSPWRTRPRDLTASTPARIKPSGYLTKRYITRWPRTVLAPLSRPSRIQRGGPSWRGWRWVRPRSPS